MGTARGSHESLHVGNSYPVRPLLLNRIWVKLVVDSSDAEVMSVRITDGGVRLKDRNAKSIRRSVGRNDVPDKVRNPQ